MLQRSTIEPHTLAVLKKLMQIKLLNSFYLVGGTCLAIRYGHRTSIDLDLFSLTDFNNEEIIDCLKKAEIPFEYKNSNNPIGLFGYAENIKVDFVKHHHFKQIDNPITEEGIRMFGDKDLMAMKIFAILKRAQKKDFWDMAELLEHHTLQNCVDAYYEKYLGNMLLISIPHALTYFTDAEESNEPVSLKGQTWESVKKIIQQKVNDYMK